MTDQNTFMETVNSVAEIVRTSEIPLSQEEIISYFDDMELNDNQKKLVLEYLMNPQSEETDGDNARKETDIQEDKEEEIFEEDEETPTQSVVFKMYMEELSHLPVYSSDEEERMYAALLEGEEHVIKKLSDCWLKRVLSIAKKYAEPKSITPLQATGYQACNAASSGGYDPHGSRQMSAGSHLARCSQELNMDDLIQEGNMALFLTLKKLCGSKEKVDVKNVLEESIESGILSYASEINSERELENAILGKVNLVQQANKLLTKENGQEPTLKELADYTKISVKELEDLMDMIKETDSREK